MVPTSFLCFRRACIATILLFLFLASEAVAQPAPNSSAITSFADEFFADAVAEGLMPGAVVAVVLGGELVHLAGYGASDPDRGISMNPQRTLMRLGSASQFLTAFVAVAAAEQGLVRLDDDARPLLEKGGILLDGVKPVTLHEFLTHTSGFGDRLAGQRVRSAENWMQLSEFLATRGPPPKVLPSGSILYSDLGITLAGAVLEQAAQEPFSDLATRIAFAPAGMESTTFSATLAGAWEEKLAQGHIWRKGALEPTSFDYVMTTPAAGATTTAVDMARWIALLLSDGGGVMGQDSISLFTNQQVTNYPKMPGRTYGFSEGTAAGRRVLYHEGFDPGFSNHVSLIPELGLGVFVAANGGASTGMGTVSPTALALRGFVHDLAAEFWVLPQEQKPDLVSLSPDDRVDYSGTYRDARVDRDTPLKIQGLIQQIFVLPISDVRISFQDQTYRKVALDVFQSEDDTSLFIRFLRTDGGEVTHMLLPNGIYEKIGVWETLQMQMVIAGLALGLILLGTIIIVIAVMARWWGRMANAFGLIAGVGGLGLALWFAWQITVFSADVRLVHGLPGMPYPLPLWFTLVVSAGMSFVLALLGRGIRGVNRFGLLFIAGGWVIYFPFLTTWQLLV